MSHNYARLFELKFRSKSPLKLARNPFMEGVFIPHKVLEKFHHY